MNKGFVMTCNKCLPTRAESGVDCIYGLYFDIVGFANTRSKSLSNNVTL